MTALLEVLAAFAPMLVLAGICVAIAIVSWWRERPTPEALAEAEARFQAMAAAHEITLHTLAAERAMYEEALRHLAAQPQQTGP